MLIDREPTLQKITDAIERLREAVCDSVKPHDDYVKSVGIIQGLKAAYELIAEEGDSDDDEDRTIIPR